MPQPDCIGEQHLRAFLLGDLTEEQARAVVLHLQTCPTCEAHAEQLDGLSDPLLHSLRRFLGPVAVGQGDTTDAAAPPKATTADMLPASVAGYEVLGVLGRGGMSVVYKARQARPARLVALKMILAGQHAGADRRARFLAEADAIARLQHPNIVQVYQVGLAADVPFFSLELVEGGNLHGKLGGAPQPPREAAALVQTLARAVQYAHERGVIHRDLKPENVLLTADGAPKIADFGLARIEQSEQAGFDLASPGQGGLTASGTVLGTPSYMAPEQAQGRNREVGPAADVYALGAILYEMLTGRPPFRAETPLDTLMQVVAEDPVPPRRLNPRVPSDLETICLKCLQKMPRRRFASAAELADELGRWLRGEAILTRPVGALERGVRWGRRNPGWAAALLLLVMVAAGSLLAVWWQYATNQRLEDADRQTQEQLLDSLQAQARASTALRQPIESFEALRRAAVVARKLGKGEDTILSMRNQAIACMALPGVRVLREWQGNPTGTNGLGFDARFERYASSSASEGIRVRQLEGDKELCRLPMLAGTRPDPWITLSFSPSGRFLLVDYYARKPRPLQVWDLKADGPRCCLPPGKAFGPAAFSADERTLAVGLPDGTIALFDLPSGLKTRDPLPKGAPAEVLAFSPDGQTLAAGSTEETVVQLREMSTGKIVRTLKHDAGVQALAWCPRGPAAEVLPVLASGCQDHRIYLWGSKGSEPQGFLEGHGWEVPQLAFDSSGTRLLSFGWDMTLRLWNVPARRLSLTLPDVRILGFSILQGLRAACLQGTQVRILELDTPVVHRVLHGSRDIVYQLDFHPRHGWLVSSGRDRIVRLWDSDRGRQLDELSVQAWEVLWESAGEGLLTSDGDKRFRWPVHVRSSETGRHVRLGPPARLTGIEADPWVHGTAWFGSDDRTVVVQNGRTNAVCLFGLYDRSVKPLTLPDPKVNFYSASPDGRWLATGTTDEGHGLSIWDVHSGEPVKTWDCGSCEVEFSRDGRWLVTTTGRLAPDGAGCYSWRVGTWERGSHVSLDRSSSAAGVLAVSPDSRVVAVANTMTTIRLLRLDTFEEIATLNAPDTPLISHMVFSHDGSHLAAAAGKTIQVWDLRALRQSLRDLGLDWHEPDYPARPADARPWQVEVGPGPGGQ
jgi:WD40 repeat protein/tRNA A-37 threonylcarbamoyl transferase component Bud32